MLTPTRIAIGTALAGAFALGAIVVGFSSAQSDENASHAPKEKVTTSFTEQQEEELNALIRAYILENPDVIIDAVNRFAMEQRIAEEQSARQAAIENLPALLDPATSFVAGKNPEKAKVAIIEMYDYHCTYCKRAAAPVKKLLESDEDVKIVFRELPILKEESDYAAEMALASRAQGKFLDLHFALLDTNGTLSKERVESIARAQKLDVEEMKSAIESEHIPDMVSYNHALASALGIDGTPAFIIAAVDGSYADVLVGFNEDALKAKIKEAKKAAG
ncbi:DsbA family protein [Hyphococcus formosus]|uniref:DsbA family protein n=1 Tax=Hyphococcus formosus TaxID=3143534 RepID=UPI00398B1BE1